MKANVCHGYYNPNFEMNFGSVEYLTPAGERVTVTWVQSARFPDDGTTLLSEKTVYVGEVTTCLRTIRKAREVVDLDYFEEAETLPDGCKCHTIHVDCATCKCTYLTRTRGTCQVHTGFNSRYVKPAPCPKCKQ